MLKTNKAQTTGSESDHQEKALQEKTPTNQSTKLMEELETMKMPSVELTARSLAEKEEITDYQTKATVVNSEIVALERTLNHISLCKIADNKIGANMEELDEIWN